MGNLRHPLVYLGMVAILLHIIAIGLRTTNDHEAAYVLMIIGFAFMAIGWIWSIIEVSRTTSLQGSQRIFWLIAVIAIPFVGGMFYHIMHSRRNRIVD